MKNIRKSFAIVLTIITIISMLSVTASAHTTDIPFEGHVGLSTRYYTSTGSKDDYSSHYFYLANASERRVFVASFACNDRGVVQEVTTLSDGNEVVEVFCRLGVNYNIHNNVKEKGYHYARLGIKAYLFDNGIVIGKWSADSIGTYNSAT